MRIFDARATERYEGRSEPVDARPGHIPGALSRPFADNLVTPGGRLRSRDELRAAFEALGAFEAEKVVCYCGSGVTACHDVLAMEVAGVRAALYAGSWSGWITDPDRPVARGPVTSGRP